MKTNYQIFTDNELEKILNENAHPSLLLHSCCGPCSSYVLEYLSKYFDITVLFYNPNIYPQSEYDKRLKEQIKLLNMARFEGNPNIKFVQYNHDDFLKKTVGLENEKEGGNRCRECFLLRLSATACMAKEDKFDYFASTLTVSPHKNAEIINEIGVELEKKFGVKYLISDFKKKNGYKRSIELSNKFDLYRQNYCGCEFSIWFD